MPDFSETELRRFVVDLFAARGMSAGDAGKVASAVVWANLRGVDTHGVVRLPRYMEMIDGGLMNMTAEVTVQTAAPGGLQISAGRAAGPVAMDFAVKQLLPCAARQGIAAAFVSCTTHTGALGYYALQAAEAGMACIAVNASIPMMPYYGSSVAAMGTNPISFAVPAAPGNDPLLFDMATSVVSLGKLVQARRTGTPLQPGCFVDANGQPTTDPAVATMTLPLGGPKGSGLSLMIECFASLLAGHPIIADALEKTGKGSRHRQNVLLIAIDIGKFVDVDYFRNEVTRLADAVRALPRTVAADAILMPGERGFKTMAKRRAEGIPVPPAVLKELGGLAGRFAIAPLRVLDGKAPSSVS
jgi:ureidoglycolate dehydrogenase (NAD+)